MFSLRWLWTDDRIHGRTTVDCCFGEITVSTVSLLPRIFRRGWFPAFCRGAGLPCTAPYCARAWTVFLAAPGAADGGFRQAPDAQLGQFQRALVRLRLTSLSPVTPARASISGVERDGISAFKGIRDVLFPFVAGRHHERTSAQPALLHRRSRRVRGNGRPVHWKAAMNALSVEFGLRGRRDGLGWPLVRPGGSAGHS